MNSPIKIMVALGVFAASPVPAVAIPKWMSACFSLLTGRSADSPQAARVPLLQDERTRLMSSMTADVFYQSNPFGPDFAESPAMKEILQRGVEHFERSIYRTTHNVVSWNSGYDAVVYHVYHPDGSVSIIQAFKHSNGSPFVIAGIGVADLRSTFNVFYVSAGDGRMTQYFYENGRLSTQTPGDLAEGIAHADSFISQSIQNRGLTEIQSPDEIVTLK